jgi:hypothetical protein
MPIELVNPDKYDRVPNRYGTGIVVGHELA